MRSVLFVALLSQLVIAQYDDLSILEEVLTRTSQRPVVRQLPSDGTTTTAVSPGTEASSSSSEAVSTSTAGELVPGLFHCPQTRERRTVAIWQRLPSTIDRACVYKSFSETTPERPSTIEEAPSSSSTASPITLEATTFPMEESTEADEMLFMGMKRPDLATIYRRLFPF